MLEIGPGTGQLSLALAPRGVRLVAVERGANLASVARRNLQQFPNAEVVTADFYEWDALEASFDAVVAATSFHWLPESTRISRSAAILRPGGSLTLIHRPDALAGLLDALGGRFGGVVLLPVHPRAGAPASRLLARAVKGSRALLQLRPGLILHEGGQGFRPQIEAILRRGAALDICNSPTEP